MSFRQHDYSVVTGKPVELEYKVPALYSPEKPRYDYTFESVRSTSLKEHPVTETAKSSKSRSRLLWKTEEILSETVKSNDVQYSDGLMHSPMQEFNAPEISYGSYMQDGEELQSVPMLGDTIVPSPVISLEIEDNSKLLGMFDSGDRPLHPSSFDTIQRHSRLQFRDDNSSAYVRKVFRESDSGNDTFSSIVRQYWKAGR